MSVLDDVAEKFVAPGAFPGDTLAEKVVAGARVTKAILDKYGLDTAGPLTDPPPATQAAIATVTSSESQSASLLGSFATLAQAFSPASDPVVLQMKPTEFFASLLWSWRSAAAGVPVYGSGFDQTLVASGDPRWTAAEMADDAARRILVFQGIVQLEQWGVLANAQDKLAVEVSGAPALRGFGAGPAVAGVPAWLIALGLAAAVFVFWVAWSSYQNSKVFDQICQKAADTGNQTLMAECIKAGAKKKDPFQDVLETLVWAAAAVALGYVIVTYALPQVFSYRASPRALPA